MVAAGFPEPWQSSPAPSSLGIQRPSEAAQLQPWSCELGAPFRTHRLSEQALATTGQSTRFHAVDHLLM